MKDPLTMPHILFGNNISYVSIVRKSKHCCFGSEDSLEGDLARAKITLPRAVASGSKKLN